MSSFKKFLIVWKPINFKEAEDYIKILNTKNFLGSSNWRIPNTWDLKIIYGNRKDFGIYLEELESLSKVVAFWSSEKCTDDIAYYIDFADFGKIKFSNINGTPYLICVAD